LQTPGSASVFPPPPDPLRSAQGEKYWLVDHLVDHQDSANDRGIHQRRYRIR
jgi:hypothetical protein